MTLTKQRKSTQALRARPRPLTRQKTEPKPHRIEPPAARPTLIRWLPWMAGVAFVVATTVVMAILMTTGDDVAETPAPSLIAPLVSDIDPHVSPEVLRGTPSLANIDPHVSPEILRVS